MKKIILWAMLLASLTVNGQTGTPNKTSILEEIEKNNTTLAALRQKAIATKQQNEVGNALPDPNIEFSNSWGKREGSPTKQNISIEQELDWGTLTGRKRKRTKSQNEVVDMNYRVERQTILAEADRLLVQLTYTNALFEEISFRTSRADELKALYERKYAAGDANQLELNKVKLSHTAIIADLRRVKSDRDEILENLKRLNGNEPIVYSQIEYGNRQLAPLNEYLQRAEQEVPQMQLASSTIMQEEQKLKLSKMEGLPNLSIGYSGEIAKGDNSNGITLGMTIPIWGNSRKNISQQRSFVTLAEMEKKDVEEQIKSTLTRLYGKAMSLTQISEQFNQELSESQDFKILDKALATGHISLIEYLNEITFYYNARSQALEAERDSHLAISELDSWFR